MTVFWLSYDTTQDDAAGAAIGAINKELVAHGLVVKVEYGEGKDASQDYIVSVEKI